ncbi:MAG TPA: sulfotransferase domain-containing protein, partial [Rhabdochlamydiaceae bacterium]|nr:sulfotransferase domain-containing protein [Rhabdochlamydiaceae bacterium]
MRSIVFACIVLFLLTAASEPPKQKIAFVSIPKSGTHLLKKAIRLITDDLPIHWIALNGYSRFDPYKDLDLPKPITGAHLFPEIDLIRTECSEHYKKILMIRDPRDVMISFMYHLKQRKLWAGKDHFDFKAFAKLPLNEQLRTTLLFPEAWRNPYTSFSYAVIWKNDPTVFACRFEDLVGVKGGGSRERQLNTLRDLALFLEYPLTEEKLTAIADQLFGGTWTFRHGKIGTWKQHFNHQNKQLFKQLVGRAVIDLGY